jgi:hypothetical protein
VDAENWKGTITLDELRAQTDTTVCTWDDTNKKLVLSPRSSAAKATDDGKLTLYSATTQEKEFIASDGTTTSENVVVTGSGSTEKIVKFDLYARNTGTTAKDLILDSESAVKGVTNSTTGIENAIRVAFVYEGTQEITGTDYATKATKLPQIDDETKATPSVWLWEPNSKKHKDGSLYANNVEVPTYAIKSPITADKKVTLTPEGIIDKTKFGDYLTADKVTADYSDTATTSTIHSIAANSIVKFTVYIWLEGQDVDCNDQTANGSFTVDLKFNDGTTTTSSTAVTNNN